MNAISRISEDDLRNGVVTHSSGNHGRAVAAAAKLFGIKASVVVPNDTPPNKIAHIKSHGAVVVTCEPTQTARNQTCYELAQSTSVCVFFF